MEAKNEKMCPFCKEPCMGERCVMFDEPSDICELIGIPDMLYDILKKLEDMEDELT